MSWSEPPLFEQEPEYVRTATGWRRNPPAQEHSPTSIAAADSIRPHTQTARDTVLAYICAHHPVTDEQIAAGTGLSPSTARPRRIELERLGLIVPLGEAPTSSGRRAVTWGPA